MGKDYFVVVADAEELCANYTTYQLGIKSSLQSVDKSLNALIGLASFRGVAAESIKNYLLEKHAPIVMYLDVLVAQLAMEYTTEYLKGVQKQGREAELPESEIKEEEKFLLALTKGEFVDIRNYLANAQASFPAGMSFSVPSTKSLEDAISGAAGKAKKVREDVRGWEDSGYAALAGSDGQLERMMTAMGELLSAVASTSASMTNYVPGSFGSAFGANNISTLFRLAMDEQGANSETMTSIQQKSLEHQQLRIEEAQAEAAKEKFFWAAVGTVAQVGLLIVGACAIVASGGLVGAAIAFAGFTVSGVNLWARTDQLQRMAGGDRGADLNSGGSGFLAEAEFADKLSGGGVDAKSAAVKYAVGKAADGVKASADDPLTEAVTDIASSGADWGISLTTDVVMHRTPGMSDPFSFAFSAVQAVADYGVSSSDKEIEELEVKGKKSEATQRALDNQRTYVWTAQAQGAS